MSRLLSPNTQAILLLTAPLLVGRGQPAAERLTLGEYNKLVGLLRERQRQPADLLGSAAAAVRAELHHQVDLERLERLLGRGLLLSQALEHWQARAIWVVSRADPDYPLRLRARLRQAAPPILYGCGEPTLLNSGGLAVVGSRQASQSRLAYAERIGRLAAEAGQTILSGGARGIDQAAMRGALQAGGRVAAVLAGGLERAALARDSRQPLLNGRLALVCPYDPAAGFQAGQAMQRNKLIYALAEAALVVSADYQRGGTWTGALEQLEQREPIPLYFAPSGERQPGLEALHQRGALVWPEPATAAALAALLASPPARPRQAQLSFDRSDQAESPPPHEGGSEPTAR